MLKCVAVYCSVLQGVTVCYSVLQRDIFFKESRKNVIEIILLAHLCEVSRVAVYRSVLHCVAVCRNVLQCVAVRRSALQCVAVCCSALQCVAVRCSVLQCVVMCCSVLQCVAVCCSVLQCVYANMCFFDQCIRIYLSLCVINDSHYM